MMEYPIKPSKAERKRMKSVNKFILLVSISLTLDIIMLFLSYFALHEHYNCFIYWLNPYAICCCDIDAYIGVSLFFGYPYLIGKIIIQVIIYVLIFREKKKIKASYLKKKTTVSRMIIVGTIMFILRDLSIVVYYFVGLIFSLLKIDILPAGSILIFSYSLSTILLLLLLTTTFAFFYRKQYLQNLPDSKKIGKISLYAILFTFLHIVSRIILLNLIYGFMDGYFQIISEKIFITPFSLSLGVIFSVYIIHYDIIIITVAVLFLLFSILSIIFYLILNRQLKKEKKDYKTIS